jgi:hypothetical protein
MKRLVAKEILQHVKALDGPLNAAMHAVEQIDDAAEKKLLRKALASVVGLVYTDVVLVIQKRFPDLAETEDTG